MTRIAPTGISRARAPARTPAEVEARRRSSYWVALKAKHERAAARSWLPVTPDPPEPE